TTKTPKVGVALASTAVVTLVVGAALHCALAGTVSHRKMLTGRFAAPVSAEAVTVPPAPTLTVATANTPVVLSPGMSTMPSFFRVAASATMSGPAFGDAVSRNVFTPETTAAGFVFVQLKLSCTSVDRIVARGVKANKKVWNLLPAGIEIGVL